VKGIGPNLKKPAKDYTSYNKDRAYQGLHKNISDIYQRYTGWPKKSH